MMAQPWEIDWADSEQDPVIAPPDPYKQRADQRADASQEIERERLDISRQTAGMQQQLNEMKLTEMKDDAAERDVAKAKATDADDLAAYKLTKAIAEMSRVALDADDNGGFLETGASGQFSRAVLPSGTAGYDLAGDLKTLNADFAFSALQAMRDASKTGGALGAITERELDLLQSSVGNLDPNLSHETFLSNIKKTRQAYLAKLAMINPQLATTLGYDSKEAEAALLELNEAYTKKFGGPAITIDRSADPNAKEQTPEDIAAIMQKYGVR